MPCLAYADSVLLIANLMDNLIRVFNDCCASFEREGLVVGAEKTEWSSSIVLEVVVTMQAGGHDVLWERNFTFVGCKLEPSGTLWSGTCTSHGLSQQRFFFLPGDRFFAQSFHTVLRKG